MKINEQELLNNYFKEAYEETKKLLSIPSYAQKPEPGKPFGDGVSKVLNYATDLATKLGFEVTKDEQGRYGFLDYGEGDETFIILCHLDVVPPGNLEEWVTPPFTPIEQDGKLIGRGAFDDKGPTMMNLYALKYLKDNGFKPDYKIRLVFGLTEETTWDSIRAYIEDHGVATIGYTPDGEFPVVYAEKWIVDMDFNSTFKTDFEIHGGDAYNVICDTVTYKGPKEEEIKAYLESKGIRVKDKEGKLLVQGKAGHASLPWVGINAATWLGKAMKEVGIDHPIVNLLADYIHLNYNGTGMVESLKDETGDLTQNLGHIEVVDGKQNIWFNYRVPAFADVYKDFCSPMRAFAKDKFNITTDLKAVEDNVYVPLDSPLITKIMKAYQDVTGDMDAKPLAIGGGTYAKSMPNVVAFGAEFDIEDSTMHAYNEYVKVDDLKKMLLIYAKAIALLAKK